MTQGFDKDYWETHWQQAGGQQIAPNPCLVREVGFLLPGTALDAGCGEGAEAIWLASQGWRVTAADISAEALSRAGDRSAAAQVPAEHLRWVEADLSSWEPDTQFDLVTTLYAHPAMPQLAFYQRISQWVAPGGTLLVVGHLRGPDPAGHGGSAQEGHRPPGHRHADHGHGPGQADHTHGGHPDEVTVTAAGITHGLDPSRWDVVTAEELTRTVAVGGDRTVELRDVVVRATRRP
ncbi:class I SAM-dependent methyltransferase [Nakamurella silvestris]|nr:class I SAM-dependent methyltransferase [Nakamurella silvestris]